MCLNKKINVLAFLLILTYGIISLFIVKDYGLTIDEPENLGIGHKYFYYFQTGHLNFQDKLPEIEFPHFYDEGTAKYPYVFYPLASTLSAATYYLFSQKLNLLDPIAAHHAIIPLLTIFLLLFMFFFVKKYWGNIIALISIITLIANPHFFGNTFHNVNGTVLIIFFSITLMMFANWILTQKIKYLYLSFIFWGLALTSRMDGLLVLPTIILWQLPFLLKALLNNSTIKIRTLVHIFIGFIITFFIIIICWPPLHPWLYKNSKEYLLNSFNFIFRAIRYAVGMGTDLNSSWNIYAPTQIFYTTPIIMLIFFSLGSLYLFFSLYKNSQKKLFFFLLVWMFFPVLRHCFPRTNHYDGLRHFLIFLVPFSIITAIGLVYLSKIIFKKINLKKTQLIITFPLFLILILPNIFSLITLHPYQTTHYNILAGGLEGALKKDIPFSGDFYLLSLKEAVEWLNEKAKSKCYVSTRLFECYGPFLLNNYPLREDLKIIAFNKDSIPSNTYLINIPRRWNRLDWDKIPPIETLISNFNKLQLVHQIRRQGGEIMTIYYKN